MPNSYTVFFGEDVINTTGPDGYGRYCDTNVKKGLRSEHHYTAALELPRRDVWTADQDSDDMRPAKRQRDGGHR
jgi:hypothetical protein